MALTKRVPSMVNVSEEGTLAKRARTKITLGLVRGKLWGGKKRNLSLLLLFLYSESLTENIALVDINRSVEGDLSY